MSRIDPVRLAQIFRSLTSKSKPTSSKTQTADKTLNREYLTPPRDPGELKVRIQKRLRQLKAEPHDFPAKAPYVAIEEIMSWEFGDQFANHPEFKHIVNSIVTNIQESPEMAAHMRTMVEDLAQP